MSADAARQTRDAQATKTRLLDAATAEFAQHGLAGARVDRVAAAAGANKQLIYAYFGNKQDLFDAVIEFRVAGLMEEVPFAADDLPGYAVRLRKFSRVHPDLVRLALWHTLERPGALNSLPVTVEANARKAAELKAAQDAGKITAEVTPAALLVQILALVHGELLAGGGAATDASLVDDAALAAAVERLTAP